MKIWNTARELIEWIGYHHNPMHENGGVDEINVAGLSGLLADDQHVLDAEVLAVAQPLDATLTSIALLGTAAGKIAYTTDVDTWAEAAITAAGRSMIVAADAAAQLALISPLTTRGDIMFRNATVSTRLAKGAANTVLVMGANDPAWSATLAGLTLTSPTINGTIDVGAGSLEVASTGTMGGLIIRNTWTGALGCYFRTYFNTTLPVDYDEIFAFKAYGLNDAESQEEVLYGEFIFLSADVSDESEDGLFRLYLINGGVRNNAMQVYASGHMWLDRGVDADEYFQVAGTQVVGARVIDARCDDAINSGDATTDGVIDALRDAMITHGLIAAA